jgi:uncharacterized protein YfdQ (DUF2303 family)
MATTVDGDAVDQIAQLATQATEPARVEAGNLYVVVTRDGAKTLDFTGDQYLDEPKRKTGTTVVRDVASFAELWTKHGVNGVSEVYADRDRLTVTAVLDAHSITTPGWGSHRLVLQLQHTTAYKAWREASGREMDQETFATFLEDNRADIHTPAAAEMLEVAQSIQATSNVEFASGHRLADGQRRIGYVETNTARAGTKGELSIPAEIVLALFVFKGATQADAFTARFRHRINGGQLRLQFKLDRPDDVVDAAFAGVVTEVAEQCATTVLVGAPA